MRWRRGIQRHDGPQDASPGAERGAGAAPQSRADAVSEPIDTSDPKAIEAHFLAALPRIQRHAKIQFSYLKGDAKDDAIAKVVGLAWKYYAAEIAKGKNPDEYISSIAKFAVKHVRAGRDVTGIEPAKDVLSKRAQREKRFTVEAFPEFVEHSHEESEAADALKNWRETPPDEAAAFHHDFPMLLDNLPPKTSAVCEDAAMGDTTTELAEKHKLSMGRISQIRTEARKKWAELAQPIADRER
jgi:hypothetical protein